MSAMKRMRFLELRFSISCSKLSSAIKISPSLKGLIRRDLPIRKSMVPGMESPVI